MDGYRSCVIKSFKHDGHLHRQWNENWLVNEEATLAIHSGMYIVVNDKTSILEADGSEWVSKVPSVTFFIPNYWYNVVALMERAGIRYYCNIASPPFLDSDTLTYIDYDLDVILTVSGQCIIVDEDEYKEHIKKYRYSEQVLEKIEEGLALLLDEIKHKTVLFHEHHVKYYFAKWMEMHD